MVDPTVRVYGEAMLLAAAIASGSTSPNSHAIELIVSPLLTTKSTGWALRARSPEDHVPVEGMINTVPGSGLEFIFKLLASSRLLRSRL